MARNGFSVNFNETDRKLKNAFIAKSDLLPNAFIKNLIIREIKDFLGNSIEVFPNRTDFKECLNHTNRYLNAIIKGQYWAITMVDSTGKLPTGILRGNTYEPGNYYQCLSINEFLPDIDYNIAGKYCPMSLQVPPRIDELFFQTNINKSKSEDLRAKDKINRDELYLGIKKGLNVPIGIVVGFCIPSKCSGRQWAEIVSGALRVKVLPYTNCRKANDKPWTGIDVTGVVVLIFIGTLMIIGTFIDIYSLKDISITYKIILSFSIITNWKKLFSLSEPSQPLDHIHGIRTLSTLWIILGHLYLIFAGSPNTSNRLDLILWSGEMKSSIFTSAPIAVDTFFFLSGFLVSWTAMKKFYLKGCRVFARYVPLYYALRYIRLVLPMAFLMLLYTGLLYHAFDGPLWASLPATAKANCEKYWWANLLFIQNFLVSYNVCIAQSWYLAADFQLYLLTPIFIFSMLKSKYVAYFLMGVLSFISGVFVYVLSHIKKWRAASVFNDARLLQERQDLLYIKPWTHAAPYLCGMILAYALFKGDLKTVRLHKLLTVFGWIICIVTTSLIIFGFTTLSDYNHVYSEWDTIYLTFSRLGWTACLSWIIFCCYYKLAGPVGTLLSLKIWRISSRLSYTVYLSHFPLIKMHMYSNPGLNYFTNEILIYEYFGVVCFSFLAAIILTLSTESPIIALLKIYFSKVTADEIKINNATIELNKEDEQTKL